MSDSVTALRATIRAEGFSEAARTQVRELIADIINPEGTYKKGRSQLDLLSLVQLFKLVELRIYFLQNLLDIVPQPVSEVSMELLADLCRVVLREANNSGDMESIAAVYSIGNGVYVERGGVRSSMLLNLRAHEAWGMSRYWDHMFTRIVHYEESTLDILGPAAKALFGISPTLFRETLLLLRFTALTRDIIFFDLPSEIGVHVAQALTTQAKAEIPRLRDAFPEEDSSFLSSHSRFRNWIDLTMTLAKHPVVARETGALLDLLICLCEGPLKRHLDFAAFQALAPDGGPDLTSRFACGHSSLRDLLVGVVTAAALKEDAMVPAGVNGSAGGAGAAGHRRNRSTGSKFKCSLSGAEFQKWELLGALGSRSLRSKLPVLVSEMTYRDLMMPPRDCEPRLYKVGYGVGAAICYTYSFGRVPNIYLISNAAYEVLTLEGSAATAIQAAFRGYRLRAKPTVSQWRAERGMRASVAGHLTHTRWETMEEDAIPVQELTRELSAPASSAARRAVSDSNGTNGSADLPVRSSTLPRKPSREETPPAVTASSAAVPGGRSSTTSRADRLLQRQREFNDFVTRLRGGMDVKKHGRRGRPHIRTVFLHGELPSDAKLCWTAPGRAELIPSSRSSVDLASVKSVKVGKDGSRFEGLISLDCSTRMLILEPATDESRQSLVRGFVQLVDHVQSALRR